MPAEKCYVYFSSTDEESVEQLKQLISEHAPDANFKQGPEDQKNIDVTGAVAIVANYLLDKPQAILVLMGIGKFLKGLREKQIAAAAVENSAVVEVKHTINIRVTGDDNVVSVITNENVNALIEQSDAGKLTLPLQNSVPASDNSDGEPSS